MRDHFLKSLTIPKFKLPGFVSVVGNKLPQWPHALVLTTGLNAVLKMKLLPEDSLELLEGRSFLVDVLDSGGRGFTLFIRGNTEVEFEWVLADHWDGGLILPFRLGRPSLGDLSAD